MNKYLEKIAAILPNFKQFGAKKAFEKTSSDLAMAATSLGEERKAIRDYGTRLKHAKNGKLRKTIAHARREEKDHAKEFSEAVHLLQHLKTKR
jgi:hypothetical protein